jgi:hypothetical protein
VAQKGVTEEAEKGDDGDTQGFEGSHYKNSPIKKNQHLVVEKFVVGIRRENLAQFSLGYVDVLRRFIFGKYIAFCIM